jgi:predicted sulfurtransferase
LQKLGVVGRIYLASDKGIGGINAQLSVPVRNIGSMQSFFDTLPEFKGVSFEYNSGMEDTDIQAFGKLKVMKKPHVRVR